MRARSAGTDYIASVRQDDGETYEYTYTTTAPNQREAAEAAREAAAQWGGTLVGLTPARRAGEAETNLRLLVIAALTLVAGGAMIATAMIAGLAL